MNKHWYIQASGDSDSIHMVEADAEPLELTAADGEDEGSKLKRFSINAYTGGPMNVGFGLPVIVDLAGMKVSAKSRPILKDHDSAQVVGHTDAITVTAGSIRAAGVVSGANGFAAEIVNSSANGFPWQASIGASIEKMVEVGDGETVEVNGKRFKGPIMVARKSTLKEISFVALGADDNTDARVAAKTHPLSTETLTMKFENWLEAQGLKLADLTDDAVTKLKATFEQMGQLQADASNADADLQADAGDEPSIKADIAELRAEHKRLANIQVVAKDHPEILAKAIDNAWSQDRTELEVLRASRPEAPNVNVGSDAGGDLSNDVIVAAACLSGGLQDIESHFDEKTLNAADKRFKGRIGLQEIFVEAARSNGYAGSPSYRRDAKGILQAAFSQNITASGGFSTLSVTDILSNTANKFLLAGFDAVEDGWRSVASLRNVSDFKTATSYRMTGDLEYEEVGPGGEIKHGSLADESFTNKAKTYAKMMAITRNDQINDDLGALTDVPKRLGRGAALKFNTVFWTEFMENAGNFYHANNSNLVTSNALSIAALSAAELSFLNQTDPDGNPLALSPSILLVPNALKVTAQQLMNSTQVNEQAVADSATGVPVPNTNPHAGSLTPVVSSYLSNSAITGNSATTWYMLANPSSLSTIEVAFLDGVQTPTVETADADFSTLGIQMRGVHDFGVTKQETRAGVKSTA